MRGGRACSSRGGRACSSRDGGARSSRDGGARSSRDGGARFARSFTVRAVCASFIACQPRFFAAARAITSRSSTSATRSTSCFNAGGSGTAGGEVRTSSRAG
ncbi:MAG: hypothetical protein ABI193_12195, partial [Minicystis sp.]